MREKCDKRGRRLRVIPLILGIYGAFLGLGLMVMGLAQMKEGIGIVRLVLGLGMVCFGVYGIWDGVRDLVKTDKKPENPPVSQFILTDVFGKKSSHVTMERLQEQIKSLMENEGERSFQIQILPPIPVQERGALKRIACIYQEKITFVAFFEVADGGNDTCHKGLEPDKAEEWFRRFLSGSPDFTGWESFEDQEFFTQKEGVREFGHQLLVIYGESWHDEHKFFTAGDLELAVEGVCDGKYQKVVLEWGNVAFDIFPRGERELMVIWRTHNEEGGDSRFWAREGTVAQVKFWLIKYMDGDFLEEMSGWTDITAQVEQEWKKVEKKLRKAGRKQ